MSAERLRAAASELRDAAEGVQAAIDDWTDSGRGYFACMNRLQKMGFTDAGDHGPVTVALAVADVLDQEASLHSSYDCLFDPCSALDLADRILAGGAS
ncbi:MAG: hypothetical protein EOP24_39055 [Hyphomicrobiales bacterium]|nr:MAG: hypothetical protein EOP24_39055 [Hyphomicrobiales bacterium]